MSSGRSTERAICGIILTGALGRRFGKRSSLMALANGIILIWYPLSDAKEREIKREPAERRKTADEA